MQTTSVTWRLRSVSRPLSRQQKYVMLSSTDIRRVLGNGSVVMEEFDESCLRASSYLLRLSRTIKIARQGSEVVDTRSTDTGDLFEDGVIGEDGLVLEPCRLYLGSSIERIGLSSYIAGLLFLLSSFARV